MLLVGIMIITNVVIVDSSSTAPPETWMQIAEPEFVNLLRSPGIDSQPAGGTTILFDVPARQAIQACGQIRALETGEAEKKTTRWAGTSSWASGRM